MPVAYFSALLDFTYGEGQAVLMPLWTQWELDKRGS